MRSWQDARVPAIVLWPGAGPRIVTQRISTVDLPLTIASLLGIETPWEVDGVDRSELI